MRGRVTFFTAARSEYDLLSPIAQEVAKVPGIEVDFLVAGAHLSPFHGKSVTEIERDGFRICGRVQSLVSSDDWEGRALSFASLTDGLTRYFATAPRPDLLFYAGDREEPLAAASVASFLRITTAHAYGGDRCFASDIDEVYRPAISKLSHLHFAATEGHRERLVRMGEDPSRVWAVGATGIDRLRTEPEISPQVFLERYGVDVTKPFFLLIQHPSPMTRDSGTGEEMRTVLDGVLALGLPVFCSYPNQDPNNVEMRAVIDEVRAKTPKLVTYHNLPRAEFVALYRRCSGILGNSSSIVLESGYLKRPGVLIGPRQDLRETGANVLRVPIEREAIVNAARRCLDDSEWHRQIADSPSLYGDGHAAERIASILASYEIPPDIHLKTMTY